MLSPCAQPLKTACLPSIGMLLLSAFTARPPRTGLCSQARCHNDDVSGCAAGPYICNCGVLTYRSAMIICSTVQYKLML